MADFFASSRVLIVAGKGGVGKTTLGATIGFSAARAGVDTLLIELDGQSRLGRPFGHHELPYEDVSLLTSGPGAGRLRGRRITPDDALLEYLSVHGLDQVGGRLLRTGAVDVVSTAAPGIRDLLALGKIRQLEQERHADLIVVDAPAAGHAITFLLAASGLASSTTSGPVREQADAVLEMFADENRCQVILVTLAEETPVNELIETAYEIEDEVGLKLGPVLINGLWPEVTGLAEELEAQAPKSLERSSKKPSKIGAARQVAARYRLQRLEAQQRERARLADQLALPQLTLPYLFQTSMDLSAIEQLSDALDDALSEMSL